VLAQREAPLGLGGVRGRFHCPALPHRAVGIEHDGLRVPLGQLPRRRGIVTPECGRQDQEHPREVLVGNARSLDQVLAHLWTRSLPEGWRLGRHCQADATLELGQGASLLRGEP